MPNLSKIHEETLEATRFTSFPRGSCKGLIYHVLRFSCDINCRDWTKQGILLAVFERVFDIYFWNCHLFSYWGHFSFLHSKFVKFMIFKTFFGVVLYIRSPHLQKAQYSRTKILDSVCGELYPGRASTARLDSLFEIYSWRGVAVFGFRLGADSQGFNIWRVRYRRSVTLQSMEKGLI